MEVTGRSDHEIRGAMQSEQTDDGYAGEHCVAAEQVEEVPDELVRAPERDAVQEVCERDAPEERSADAAERVQAEPHSRAIVRSRARSRHSNETTRRISRTRINSSAR